MVRKLYQVRLTTFDSKSKQFLKYKIDSFLDNEKNRLTINDLKTLQS